MMELDADFMRSFFPDLFANASSQELDVAITEARKINPSGEATLVAWLAAHLHQTSVMLAGGEIAEGLDSTPYGAHYAFRLQRQSTLEIGQ